MKRVAIKIILSSTLILIFSLCIPSTIRIYTQGFSKKCIKFVKEINKSLRETKFLNLHSKTINSEVYNSLLNLYTQFPENSIKVSQKRNFITLINQTDKR